MKPGGPSGGSGPAVDGPPPRPVGLGAALRQAWVGYHRRLDEAMAAAGFDDHGFPDGRVLRTLLPQPRRHHLRDRAGARDHPPRGRQGCRQAPRTPLRDGQ